MSFINPDMTEPAWYTRAKSLRQAGFTYKSIGEFCNVSVDAAYYAIHAEQKRLNRRVPIAKTAFREIELTSENLAKITEICENYDVTLDVLRSHSHLKKANKARRKIISYMLNLNCTQRQIGDMLFTDRSSICNIIKRGLHGDWK